MARKFFINFNGGSDQNNGLTQANAWKRCPGMQNFGGSYSHQAGDQFIFKGGVTWPVTCFPLGISAGGGSASNRDYYGVDQSWFVVVQTAEGPEGSWTQPTFDWENAGNMHVGIEITANYVTLDNFVFYRFKGDGDAQASNVRVTNGDAEYLNPKVKITNCHFRATNQATNKTEAYCLYGNGSDVEADYCEFEQSDLIVSQSVPGHGILGCGPNVVCAQNVIIVDHCYFHHTVNACVGNGRWSNSEFGPMNHAYVEDGDVHGNAAETFGNAQIYNNTIHDLAPTVEAVITDPTVVCTIVVYNNLIWNSGGKGISFDSRRAPNNSTTQKAWNNTIVGGQIIVGGVGFPTILTADVRNNHVINGSISILGPVTNPTNQSNLVQSTATATSEGYVFGNLWQPTDSGDSTVGTGENLSAFFSTDRLGFTRFAPWDKGCYEWGGVPTKPVITSSSSATGTVNNPFTYLILATGSPTSYGATPLPAGLSVNSSTGVISGTPTATGSTNVTVSATNSVGTGTATLSLTIQSGVVSAPVITSPVSANGQPGIPFSYTITATNSPTSYTATPLPIGLTVNSSSGIISGTPSTSGTTNSTIGATNSGGTGTATLSIVIASSPAITVTPSQWSFPNTQVGTTSSPLSFTVANTGTGTLSGAGSVTGQFATTGDATYSLGAGQAKPVQTVFSPTSKGYFTSSVVFTGGAGASRTVTGLAYTVQPSLTFEADTGTIVAPFTATGTRVSQAVQTTVPSDGGKAVYGVTIPVTGDYTVSALVNCADGARNSFFINFDSEPTSPDMIWDIVQVTNGYETRTACWRGTGTDAAPQIVPKTWTLTAGVHQLIIRGREANAGLGTITINPPGPIVPPAPAPPTSPSPANNATGVSVGTSLSWTAGGTVNGYNVALGTTNPPPVVSTNTSGTTYNPPAQLQYNTTYYARVYGFLNWSSGGQSGQVKSTDLAWSFTTEAIVVPPSPLSIIFINATPGNGTAPLAVTFASTVAGGTGSKTYDWDWKDGTTHGATANPSHTFTTAGTYPVELTVTDSGTPAQVVHSTVTVNATAIPPPPPLSVTISAVPNSATTGQNVTFARTVAGGTAGAKTYLWEFGDGATSTSSNSSVTHSYSTFGSKLAKVTVTDIAGATASAAVIVVVAAFPPAVAMNSPANNTIYNNAPTTVALGAIATANGGATITGVSFYRAGSTLIHAATLVSGVWTYSWTSVAAGSYTITAKATDSTATVSTSTPINITVLPANSVAVPNLIFVT